MYFCNLCKCIVVKIIKIKMKNRLGILILLIMMILSFVSCSEKQDENVISQEFQGEIWGRFDYLYADFDVKKAPMTADLVMDVDVSEVFPNIYPYRDDESGVLSIVMTINNPDESRRAREYQFRLKDANGNFKSEKVDGYYHFELPLINDMSFNEKGVYHFKIENKYSKDPLYGIKSLNIRCVQKEK